MARVDWRGREGGSRALEGEDAGEEVDEFIHPGFKTLPPQTLPRNVRKFPESDDGKLSVFSHFLMERALRRWTAIRT